MCTHTHTHTHTRITLLTVTNCLSHPPPLHMPVPGIVSCISLKAPNTSGGVYDHLTSGPMKTDAKSRWPELRGFCLGVMSSRHCVTESLKERVVVSVLVWGIGKTSALSEDDGDARSRMEVKHQRSVLKKWPLKGRGVCRNFPGDKSTLEARQEARGPQGASCEAAPKVC